MGAAATCQFLLLVNAVIVLELEDGLGLVTRRSSEDAVLPVGDLVPSGAAVASCDVFVEELRVVGPATASIVTGPATVARPSAEAGGLVLEGAAEAVCSYALFVGVVVLGGPAYGIPAGTPGPIVVSSGPAHASCRADAATVTFV